MLKFIIGCPFVILMYYFTLSTMFGLLGSLIYWDIHVLFTGWQFWIKLDNYSEMIIFRQICWAFAVLFGIGWSVAMCGVEAKDKEILVNKGNKYIENNILKFEEIKKDVCIDDKLEAIFKEGDENELY